MSRGRPGCGAGRMARNVALGTLGFGYQMTNRRIGVLISGRGSNLQAIIDCISDGSLDAVIAVVISNKPNAPGLERAKQAGIETLDMNHRNYGSRVEFDLAVVAELKQRDVALVCLAGFMRLLSAEFVSAFPDRVLNIHPSLLPAFPGLHGQAQAWEYGVKVSGATVHIVTPELDAGPVVRQAVVPLLDDDTPDTLAARILVEEHRIYPEAIAMMLDGEWRVDGRRFVSSSTDHSLVDRMARAQSSADNDS